VKYLVSSVSNTPPLPEPNLRIEYSISDEEILNAFKEESRKELAFTWLMRRDQKKIYWFVRRMVIDHDDANDLVQEVFIKVWNNLAGFRGESRLIYWIYRIATNITLTFLDRKKKKSWLPLLSVDENLLGKLRAGKDISGNAIQIRLQEAILRLPAKQRIVFQMRYYDEIPYEEMSGILETSVGALKASYHHAAKKIEKFVTEE
jgi:RNA polymerase sigma-70 factor (ECF subfamily)